VSRYRAISGEFIGNYILPFFAFYFEVKRGQCQAGGPERRGHTGEELGSGGD